MTVEIGSVEEVQSSAFGTPLKEEKRELNPADDVHSDEVVETVRDAALHLRFLDDTDLRLGSNAKVLLDKFVYDPDAQAGELSLSVGRGIFRMVTGEISSGAVVVNTPLAIAGVRGTDWVGLLTANAFIVFVIQGSVWVKPVFGDNVQEYIVNALETLSVSLSGRVTYGVDIPGYDSGLGDDLIEVMVNPQAGQPAVEGSDDVFFQDQGSALPFNSASFSQLIKVILERVAEIDPTGNSEPPEDLILIVAPGNSDSNILFNAILNAIQSGGAVTAPAAVLELEPELAGVAEIETGAGTPPETAVVVVVVVQPDPDVPQKFTLGSDTIDLSDIAAVLTLVGLGPGDQAVLLNAIANQSFNVSDALAGADTVQLPSPGDALAGLIPTFQAGAGDDTVTGGSGGDTILGGTGNDTLSGGDGSDLLEGDEGNDRLYGGGGNDTVQGSAGNDIIVGNAGDDTLSGGSGNDLIQGRTGEDTLFGGSGNDTLDGDNGNDVLFGNAGQDRLFGDQNDDTLFGGTEVDALFGGAGSDVFGFEAGDGGSTVALADLISDFVDGTDRIGLAGGLAFADLLIDQSANVTGGGALDTVVVDDNDGSGTLNAGDEVLAVLLDTTPALTEADDFVILP